MHVRRQAKHGAQPVDKLFLACRDALDGIREHLVRHFHLNVQRIAVLYAVDYNLIIGRIAVIKQDRFDLRREHVDAADDQHIVAAAHRLGHLDMRASARARFAVEYADIARAVAQQRKCLLRDARKDQLALFP